MRNVGLRIGIVVALVVLALYAIYPTIRLYSAGSSLGKDEILSLQKRAIHLGLDLKGGMHLILTVDKSGLSEEEARGAVDRALEIIKNRIDQFGVYEPTVEKMSGDRILIQLPGVDRDRALSLIRQVALLEFKLVEEGNRFDEAVKSIDNYFQKPGGKKDTLFMEAPALSAFFEPMAPDYGVDARDEDTVKAMISQAAGVMPADLEFVFGPKEEYKSKMMRRIYLLKRQAELKGDAIRDASHTPNMEQDLGSAGTWEVDLQFDRKAAGRFAAITGANIGRRLAIVLDGIVQSAPQIRQRIPQGRARITGRFKAEEARDLAIILRAGALPAPVRVIEERSVGPSWAGIR